MRIPAKPLSQYPWYVRFLLRQQIKKYGAPLEPVTLWGRIPRVFLGFIWMQKAFFRRSSSLSPVLKMLVMIRVSQIRECSFCISFNSANLKQVSGSNDKLSELHNFRESPAFNEKEKLALEYAESIMLPPYKASDSLFSKMRTEFKDDAIVELTALVAYQNLSSMFNVALDV